MHMFKQSIGLGDFFWIQWPGKYKYSIINDFVKLHNHLIKSIDR